MTPANESPAFPSVGARARFTFDPRYESDRIARHSGEDCVVTDGGVASSWWVTFDDGSNAPVLASELSPLPAAPQNEETNG
jgi:hypothetical protein